MALYLKLAIRNVFRNRRRTLITLAAMGFGAAAIIVFGGFVHSIYFGVRESTIRSQVGHIQIYRKGYSDKGNLAPYDYLITDYAGHFVQPNRVTVVKYDMGRVEVLALLRPARHDQLTLEDLSSGFQTACAMLECRPDRYPVASVCFLGARANKLVDGHGEEPSFETVLQVMYNAGYRGDVYPSPWMWDTAPTAVFPRYPFPPSFKQVCEGGF